jgi:predicted esterase
MRKARVAIALAVTAIALAVLGSSRLARAESARARWCAPELEALSEAACYFAPTAAPAIDGAQPPQRSRSLVIFLHPLVGAGSDWQWDQQRMFARLGTTFGFSVLMPRGRLGVGPKRAPNIYAWPTSANMQTRYEDEIIDEWMQARRVVEKREGKFEKVLIFGFSNGAYYATSLAMRGRLEVDGYGIFAGGSGSKYLRLLAAKAERRSPIFVGYGTKDPAHHDQRDLIKMLRALSWKHRVKSAHVGHTVTEDQIRGALGFLGVLEPASARDDQR